MTFAGIPVGVLIAVLGGGFLLRNAWKEWRQDRADAKAQEFHAAHVWKARVISGVDQGEWVRKDGRPIGIDD